MKSATVVIGCGFGDEGKGSVVDALCAQANPGQPPLVVRFNGGPQAAHHVVLDDGREHCFSQFGSGTLAGAASHFSSYCLFDPVALAAEAAHLEAIGLRDPYATFTVSPDAIVLTPYHRILNRLREAARGAARHGSCGLGIGEAMRQRTNDKLTIYVRDVASTAGLTLKLYNWYRQVGLEAITMGSPDLRELNDWPPYVVAELLQEHMRHVVLEADQARLAAFDEVCFEGAQGVLLDERYGFFPHVTYSRTTTDNAFRLISQAAGRHRTVDTFVLGLTRSFATRHGAGPFPTEDRHLAPACLRHERNTEGAWQQDFRVGALDLVLLRYALSVAGPVDAIGLTHLDAMDEATLVLSYLLPAGGTEFFGLSSGGAVTLWPVPPEDFDRRHRLTDALKACRPSLMSVERTTHLPQVLPKALGKPVSLISIGPTRSAKFFQPSLAAPAVHAGALLEVRH